MSQEDRPSPRVGVIGGHWLMNYERWRRIEQLFHAALQRDKEQRASFLAEACSDDEALRREVELLLAVNQQAAGLLSSPALEVEARNLAERLADSPPVVAAGQEMGHYRILSRIGGGGMGEVFLAEDTRLDRKVAIKFLPTFLEADEMAKKRLTREAKAAAALDHPNICTVYEVGNYESLPFIAMQNIAGKSIHDLLARGPFPIERALKYALDIADALGPAHSRGIIHRDIKPSNVMINERDAAVVLDFGLAKQIAVEGPATEEAATLLQLTSEMTIMGTPGYMSPEQVRREALDARSDIFSFGILVYEMLAAVRPFSGAHTVDVLHAILYDEPKPLSELRPQAGTRLDSVIRKCLAKERADRYQSFAEVRSGLLAIIDNSGYKERAAWTGYANAGETDPGAAARTTPAAAFTDRLTAKVTNVLSAMKWRSAGVVLAGAVLIGAAWWLFIKPNPQSDSEFIGSLTHIQLINWKDQGGTFQDSHGVLSPDGKVIAYRSRASGKSGIYTKQTGGGDSREVVVDDWNNSSPIWSPDSKRVCYCSEKPEPGLWLCDADGQGDVKVTDETDAGSRLSSPLWSPDGARIAYLSESHGEKATWSVRVSDLKTGVTKSVHQTDFVARLLGWSPDGALFIATIEGRASVWSSPAQVKIVRLSVEQGIASPVGLADFAYLYTTELSPDGQLVAFVSRQEGKGNIFVLSTRDGKTRRVTANNDPRLFFSALTWSPDSKRILFDKQSRYSLLHLINNFR